MTCTLQTDIIQRIGQSLKKTRDAITYSSLCKATRNIQWTGQVVVTERWIDQFPPRNKQLNIRSLTFKRYGRFNVEAFGNMKTLESLRYQCCRVPYTRVLEVVNTLSTTLHHLHVHCLDPGVMMHPSVTPILSLPNLETLDITLAIPEAWGIVYIVPHQLSRSLKTLILRGAQYIWCEDDAGHWPDHLETLELGTTTGILMHVLPTTLQRITLHSPMVKIDDEDIFGTTGDFRYLQHVTLKTRGAFGLQWLRRVPELRTLTVHSDTIILDASLGFPKKIESLSLESLAYFAMTFLHLSIIERLRSIPHTDFRAMGGKRISIDTFL